MAATVVAHRALQVLWQRLQLLHQLFDRQVGVLGAFQRSVDVVDVGLVVLGVMDFHRGRVDMRLKGVVGVGQLGEGIGHVVLLVAHSPGEDRALR
ncbi:hypothetical protein D3C72_1947530 [compost metagenome]